MTYFRQKSANVLPGIIGGLAGGVSSAIAAKHMTKDPNNTRRNMVLSGIGGTMAGAGLGLTAPTLMKKVKGTKSTPIPELKDEVITSTQKAVDVVKDANSKPFYQDIQEATRNYKKRALEKNKRDRYLHFRKNKTVYNRRPRRYQPSINTMSPEKYKQQIRKYNYVKYNNNSVINHRNQIILKS